MLRSRQRAASTVAARLIYSARTQQDIIYSGRADAARARRHGRHSGRRSPGNSRPAGTDAPAGVDEALLREVAWPACEQPLAYVCGPTAFAEAVSATLVDLGYPPQRVKIERFGGTGGP